MMPHRAQMLDRRVTLTRRYDLPQHDEALKVKLRRTGFTISLGTTQS
jgi:hypothetical protein